MKISQPHRTHVFYVLIIINIILYHYLYDQFNFHIRTYLLPERGENIGRINEAVASTQDNNRELSREEWIRREVEAAGLDWETFSCIIKNESGWNDYAINKNTNKTFDTGILQINDVHKLPRWFTFDYKMSTLWAIKKRQADGNYNAWSMYKKCK
jgi:hypothetical protein